MPDQAIFQLLRDATATGILVAVIWGLLTRRIIPAYALDAAEKDKQYYRERWEQSLDRVDRAVTVVDKVVPR